MIWFFYDLVHFFKLFKTIRYIFPIRGHSYLPNDQGFSLIEAKKRKHAPEVEADWEKLIKSVRVHLSPFNLSKICQEDIFDMASSLFPYFLTRCKSPMKLRGVRMVKMSEETSDVLVQYTYNGAWEHIIVHNAKNQPTTLNLLLNYSGPLTLKPSKLKDIRRLASFLF